MVADFFEMDGWDTFYVGANAPARSVAETVAERGADVLAVSATITSHVREVRELVGAVRASAECRGVKVIAGGYPFNVEPALWREVGADATAADAASADAIDHAPSRPLARTRVTRVRRRPSPAAKPTPTPHLPVRNRVSGVSPISCTALGEIRTPVTFGWPMM
jgi:hypothetical protein